MPNTTRMYLQTLFAQRDEREAAKYPRDSAEAQRLLASAAEARARRDRESGSVATGPGDLSDLRRGRWYHTDPITPTGNTPGGGAMGNIEEARAAIMAGIEQMNEGLGATQQGHSTLTEAQGLLQHGTEGSNQPEADQAHAQLADAINKLDEVQQQVAAALQEFEGVAQRL